MLTQLDASHCPDLELINCDQNQISDLRIANSTNLKILSCASNQLSTIDVQPLKKLNELNCAENPMTEDTKTALATWAVEGNHRLTI